MSRSSDKADKLSPEKIALLKAKLKQRGIDTLKIPPITRRNGTGPWPLSFAQQRLWFLYVIEPTSIAYLLPSAMQLDGMLNMQVLEQSLQEMVRRHEGLRTTFEVQSGQPVQVIHPAGEFTLPLVDLRGLTDEACAFYADQLAEQERQRPCDLSRGPLLRVWLLRKRDTEHLLLITMHHIISDAWSGEIFYRELTILYLAFSEGKPSPLIPLSIQYVDFTLWQQQWLQGSVLEQQMAYWREQLAGMSPLDLPTDHPRSSSRTYRGALHKLLLPVSLQESLLSLSRQEQVTLFMLLLAAFQILLANYSGQQDISVGTAVAGRTHKDLEGLIGFFINILVLRTQVSGHLSFVQLLGQVREMALGAYAHQDVPFERLVEVLQPERDFIKTPLLQAMFTLQQSTLPSSQVESSARDQMSLSVEKIQGTHAIAKFDLTLRMTGGPQGFVCAVEYNTDIFTTMTIQRLLQHWQTLLEGIVEAPQTLISRLSLLSEAERKQLMAFSQESRQELPVECCLHRLISAQVQRSPDAIALLSQEEQLSYAALERQANRLAHWLLAVENIQPEERIGVCLTRGSRSLISWLAILKAGGVTVPLEADHPPVRLARMLADAQIRLVLSSTALFARTLEACTAWHVRVGDPQESDLCKQSEQAPRDIVQPGQLAYIMYTSGSTGEPKGVMVIHEAISNRLLWGIHTIRLHPEDRVLQVAGSGFDIAWWEWCGALLSGATVVVSGEQGARESLELLTWMGESQVTVAHFVPAVLRVLLEQDWRGCESLRCLLYGGDVSGVALVKRVREVLGNVELQHYYGPTEASINALWWNCRQDEEIVPIGRPISNLRVVVLDRWGGLVPVGTRGEIYLGGIGLARGYQGRSQETAERFVPDGSGDGNGERLYRTGDLGKYREDGTIIYLGRIDEQVKIRGHRIEPGEIEGVLEMYESVRGSAVKVWEREGEEKMIVAYVVAMQGEEVKEEGLREFLRERLPDYMQPWRIEQVESLPLTANGKVDYRGLPLPASLEEEAEEERTGTQIEELVGQIVQEVLRKERIGLQQDFFDAGGHSLLATQVVSRLRSVLGVDLAVRVVFEAPTVAELAERIEQEMRGGYQMKMPPLLPAGRGKQPLPASFAQQRVWFLEQLEADSTAYLISSTRHLQGRLGFAALLKSLQELVRRHEVLRTTFEFQEKQLIQVIHPAGVFRFPVVDLQRITGEESRQQMGRLVKQEKQRPCNLQHGPLLRVWLLRAGREEHVLLFTMHHIISDGWSNEVFYRELTILYQAFVEGQPSPLPPLSIQYADFALWQRQWLQGAVLQQYLAYWKKQLAGATPMMLSTDRPRPEVRSYRGASYSFMLPLELSQSLVALSRQEKVTLFMTLLAAFQCLLYRYTGQTDIVVGTDVANRTDIEAEALIGFFVNLLALRTSFSGNPIFRSILYSVREMLLNAYVYQHIPFEMLVEHLRLDRKMNYTPLVQVLFVMQNTPSQYGSISPASSVNRGVNNINESVTDVKFDISLFVQESPGGIYGIAKYSTDIFNHSTIVNMMQHFEVLLQNIVRNPGVPVALLDIQTTTEKETQIREKHDKLAIEANRLRQIKGQGINIIQG